ncbi:MAG: hypothetical protein ACYS1C_02445, partial [Planctomycetota bacterium]
MPDKAESPDRADLTIELPCDLTPSAQWRSDRFLVFDAVNDGPYMADVVLSFAEGERRMHVALGLFPGLLTRLVLPFEYLNAERVIPGRTPHRFKCVCMGEPLDPTALTSVRLTGRTPGGTAQVRISEPGACDETPAEWPHAEKPIVDELHQWADREWPGKADSLEVIHSRLTEELLATEVGFSEDLDRWGGWREKQFEATGFFRTHHDGERWWLVDPDGCAFYSVGVDCVGPRGEVETAGNEDLFADLPAPHGDYGYLWRTGPTGLKTLFDGMAHNLSRAFGESWFEAWRDLSSRRLMAWGFNTVGNWSDLRFCRFAGLPYVWPLSDFPTTGKTIFRDFPDVFSEDYLRSSRRFAEQLEILREDPRLIGYFLRNEPHWAFGQVNLAERMLLGAEPFASRERLVQWLKERYGTVGALNGAWDAGFPGFDALSDRPISPDWLASDAARADLKEFNRLMIDHYVRVPSDECRRVDPNHLNLGMRYAWIAHEDLLAGADCFDVFSINAYQDRPDPNVVARCSEAAGAPVLVGEFHTGALDRGLPAGGLRMVWTQQERANSYRYYVEQAAAMPELVGA